jgi:TetR/AcrR family transcriptional regulator, tetracycline repressor protein
VARRTGQTPLSRERIVDAALALIDADGVEGLSMRKLGARLGVDPMAVYHHLASKEAVLERVVEQVFGDLAVPDATAGWADQVRQWAEAYRDTGLRHPHLVLEIVTRPTAVAAAAVRADEALYRALVDAGLSNGDVVMASDVIVDFVNGYLLGAATNATTTDEAQRAFEAALDARPADAVKTQRRVLDDAAASTRDSFRFGLDVLIDGIALRAREAG